MPRYSYSYSLQNYSHSNGKHQHSKYYSNDHQHQPHKKHSHYRGHSCVPIMHYVVGISTYHQYSLTGEEYRVFDHITEETIYSVSISISIWFDSASTGVRPVGLSSNSLVCQLIVSLIFIFIKLHILLIKFCPSSSSSPASQAGGDGRRTRNYVRFAHVLYIS